MPNWAKLYLYRSMFGGGRFAHVSVEPGRRFVPEEGTRRFGGSPPARLHLTAHEADGASTLEMGFDLELMLPEVDTALAYGPANRYIGSLVALETAPATADTVQVDLDVQDALGGALGSVFDLAKLRARVLYHADGYYVLRFTREMPAGWPEAPHAERDESAFTARTAAVPGGTAVAFGLPWVRHGLILPVGPFPVGWLPSVVSRLAHGLGAG